MATETDPVIQEAMDMFVEKVPDAALVASTPPLNPVTAMAWHNMNKMQWMMTLKDAAQSPEAREARKQKLEWMKTMKGDALPPAVQEAKKP